MALRISSADMADFALARAIEESDALQQPVVLPDAVLARIHRQAGRIVLQGAALPGMMMSDMHWQTAEAVEIQDHTPSRNININFQVRGHMHTHFFGLGRELDMRAGRHNLVYVPEEGDNHRIGSRAELEMVHISIDSGHFINLIGSDGAWSERVLRDIEAGRAAGMVTIACAWG